MKIFIHNSRFDYANSYLVGPEGPGDALLVDPVGLDVPLLEMIENNRYYLRAILLTSPNRRTVEGVRTLKRVYDAEIYSSYPRVLSFASHSIEHPQHLLPAGIELEAVPLEQYSRYSLLYRIDNALFTGTMLSAGLIGEGHPEIERRLISAALREATASFADETEILPMNGPPSTLGAERRFNTEFRSSDGPESCARRE